MKILCLSDLHRVVSDRFEQLGQDAWIAELMEKYHPDVVVITGDIFESNLSVNPYEELHRLFNGLPVICTLGNHEFCYTTVKDVLSLYETMYDPQKWNVHYLDIVGAYDIGKVHFFGNVLWYDGSTASVENQNLLDFANNRWLDRVIVDFDPLKECERCVNQIMDNQPGVGQVGVLCTHTVPAIEVNGHYSYGLRNLFDAFSGVDKLLEKVRCDYAISGHTHRTVIGKVIDGVMCINTGNDYTPPFRHYLLQLN